MPTLEEQIACEFWIFVAVLCIIGGVAIYANWLRPMKSEYERQKAAAAIRRKTISGQMEDKE